jgi:putative transposase
MSYQVWYRRALPHWQPGGVPLFITWRLADSLPAVFLADFAAEQERIAHDPRAQDEHSDWATNAYKRLFVRWDDELHKLSGPRWLAQPEIAAIVRDAMHQGQDEHLYRLYAYTVMSNHVHVLLQPLEDAQTGQPAPLARITQLLKGRTARFANQHLRRTGQRFWARESYDHWSRNEGETRRIVAYILDNPVKAGLVAEPSAWPWSWAAEL